MAGVRRGGRGERRARKTRPRGRIASLLHPALILTFPFYGLPRWLKLRRTAEHLIDGSEKIFVGWALNFCNPHVIESSSNMQCFNFPNTWKKEITFYKFKNSRPPSSTKVTETNGSWFVTLASKTLNFWKTRETPSPHCQLFGSQEDVYTSRGAAQDGWQRDIFWKKLGRLSVVTRQNFQTWRQLNIECLFSFRLSELFC